MSPLTRLLLISAFLAFCCASTSAKEIKGAPNELTGAQGKNDDSVSVFGKNAGVCESSRRMEGVDTTVIGRYKGEGYFSDCLGKFCDYTILSHHRIRSGFAMRLRYNGGSGTAESTLFVTKIQGNIYKFWRSDDSKSQTLLRCSKK